MRRMIPLVTALLALLATATATPVVGLAVESPVERPTVPPPPPAPPTPTLPRAPAEDDDARASAMAWATNQTETLVHYYDHELVPYLNETYDLRRLPSAPPQPYTDDPNDIATTYNQNYYQLRDWNREEMLPFLLEGTEGPESFERCQLTVNAIWVCAGYRKYDCDFFVTHIFVHCWQHFLPEDW